MAESQDKGKEFEDKVSKLFKLMGFKTELNKSMNNCQIDIYGEMSIGPSKIRMIVECKNYGLDKNKKPINVGIEDITKFVGVKYPLLKQLKVEKTYFVTTNGFTQDAKTFAENSGIECFTYVELLNNLINFESYLDRLVEDYEKDELSKYYVDLDAEKEEEIERLMPAPTRMIDRLRNRRPMFMKRKFRQMKEFTPIDSYIDQWLQTKGKNHISILGEYGTGKTSFCRKYVRDIALRYKNDPTNTRIPILINLREITKTLNIEPLITHHLVNVHGIKNADYETFQKMNEEGLFLLIFDGFDEMAQKVDINVMWENFYELAKTVTEKSKIIITCRTEYFPTAAHERRILCKDDEEYVSIGKRPEFDIIYLKPFTEDKIKQYLKKRVPDKANDFYKKIEGTYNLMDFAYRPVLLDIIVQTLPQLIERGEPINEGKLYETYTNFWLDWDYKKGTTFIPKDQKQKLMLGVAFEMFDEGKLVITSDEMPKIVRKYFPELKESDLKEIAYHSHDILTCSYLKRKGEKDYKFDHKSIMEYLVARKFAQDIENDNKDYFGRNKIITEICTFLKGIIKDKQRLYEWIDFTKTNGSDKKYRYLGGNAITMLNKLGGEFKGKDLSHAKLEGADFSNSYLTKANISGAVLKNANLNNTILNDVDFSYADLEGTTFEEMSAVNSVFVTSDKKFIVSGGDDRTIKIWDFERGEEIRTLKGHNNQVWSVFVTPDKKHIVSGSDDRTIKVWDFERGEEIRTLKGHNDRVWSVFVTPDKKHIVSGSSDNTIKIWDFEKGDAIRTLKGHNHSVLSVFVTPDKKHIVSGSWDRTIRIWDFKSEKEIRTLKGHDAFVNSVFVTPDGKYIVSGSIDNTIKVWDFKSEKEIRTLKGHNSYVQSVFVTSDRKYIVSGSWDTTIKIWDFKSEKEIRTLKGHNDYVWSVFVTPDKKHLVSGSDDETIKIWDFETGECIRTIEQKLECSGMNIKGAKGLSEEQIEFLKKRGAVN